MGKPLIPIAFPSSTSALPDGATVLASDIGGTKTDMAIFEMKNGAPTLIKERRYASKDWPSLVVIARDFSQNMPLPQRGCISFAGPIHHGRAHGTNLHWDIDSHEISEQLGIENMLLINDLEANCYGLAALTASDLMTIFSGKNGEPGNAAVISPGTGLGEGGLFWDGRAYHPFATEGGHAHFAARNELDWELYQYLQRKYGHVSWERVISGPGICMIFSFLRDEKGWEMPEILREEFKTHDTAAAISIAASEGCSACAEALRMFTRNGAYGSFEEHSVAEFLPRCFAFFCGYVEELVFPAAGLFDHVGFAVVLLDQAVNRLLVFHAVLLEIFGFEWVGRCRYWSGPTRATTNPSSPSFASMATSTSQ